MPTVAHNRLQPRSEARWTRAAQFADAVLSLPMTAARMAYGFACEAARSEGMVGIGREVALRRARIRRDHP